MATDPLRGPRPDDEPRAAGPPVVVTGADTALGREVVARLREAGPVVALGAGGGAGGRSVDLATADLKPLFEGAEVVVHVGTPSGAALDEASAAASADVAIAQRVLDAAGDVDAAHVVVLSSATVYGAWANNAMPLTEDATLRPVPELALAVQRAEIERRVAEWRQAHPGKTATVLRPVPVVGGDAASDGLARALHAARRVADIEGDPPAQFLHVDDLAAAIALAAVVRIDGARNVAPDGWLRGAEYTALDAGTPKVRLPAKIGDRISRLRWKLGLAPTPPGLVAYARHPWVVANDRLRADGWEPEHSNEEAFVLGTPATALATLSPRRRQEIALGVTGAVGAAALGGAAWAVVRHLRRRP
ncbi:MAG: NAD-dependent epimerase/dehydratase family protein [Acidimicrobiales bacterium]|nr:NAD-dependent epimerase/dehydratase family protein [Acidimicrobiales bacterium]